MSKEGGNPGGGPNRGGMIPPKIPGAARAPGGMPGGRPKGAMPGGGPGGKAKPWRAARAGSTAACSGMPRAVASVIRGCCWLCALPRTFFIQSGMVSSSNVPPSSRDARSVCGSSLSRGMYATPKATSQQSFHCLSFNPFPGAQAIVIGFPCSLCL